MDPKAFIDPAAPPTTLITFKSGVSIWFDCYLSQNQLNALTAVFGGTSSPLDRGCTKPQDAFWVSTQLLGRVCLIDIMGQHADATGR